jgi:mRNA interferase RelE/StbE
VEILFESSFERDLKKLKIKELQLQIKEVIQVIKQAETLNQITGLKKLKNHKSFYRIRLGDYRLGLELADDQVILVRILHRREIYRYFP